MLAEKIEVIGVEAGLVRRLKAFAQLDIEDLEAQAAGRVAILDRLRQTKPVAPYLGMNARRRNWSSCKTRKRKLGRGYRCGGCSRFG